MADSLSTLQARRDALQAALDSGARSVSDGGSTVTYNSLAEMQAALRSLDERIVSQTGATPVRRTYGAYIRGTGL